MRTTINLAVLTIISFTMGGCGSKQGADHVADSSNDSGLNDYLTTEIIKTAEKPGVDLGLSVNWAECNVGADAPEEIGFRIPLGNTKGTTRFEDVGQYVSGTKYDIAKVQLGEGWRIPTGEEFRELLNECTWTEETVNGRNGYRVTGPNENSIFLPCSGELRDGEVTSNLDIVYKENHPSNNEGNYWLGEPLDVDSHGIGFNLFTFYIDSGKRQFYWCESNSLSAVRPVHD